MVRAPQLWKAEPSQLEAKPSHLEEELSDAEPNCLDGCLAGLNRAWQASLRLLRRLGRQPRLRLQQQRSSATGRCSGPLARAGPAAAAAPCQGQLPPLRLPLRPRRDRAVKPRGAVGKRRCDDASLLFPDPEDDPYDPRKPENIRPATAIEVAEEEARLRELQRLRLEAAILARERSGGDPTVLRHYRQFLQETSPSGRTTPTDVPSTPCEEALASDAASIAASPRDEAAPEGDESDCSADVSRHAGGPEAPSNSPSFLHRLGSKPLCVILLRPSPRRPSRTSQILACARTRCRYTSPGSPRKSLMRSLKHVSKSRALGCQSPKGKHRWDKHMNSITGWQVLQRQ